MIADSGVELSARIRRRVGLVGAVVSLIGVAVVPGAQADRRPVQQPTELWRAYPLEQTPTTSAPAPASPRADEREPGAIHERHLGVGPAVVAARRHRRRERAARGDSADARAQAADRCRGRQHGATSSRPDATAAGRRAAAARRRADGTDDAHGDRTSERPANRAVQGAGVPDPLEPPRTAVLRGEDRSRRGRAEARALPTGRLRRARTPRRDAGGQGRPAPTREGPAPGRLAAAAREGHRLRGAPVVRPALPLARPRPRCSPANPTRATGPTKSAGHPGASDDRDAPTVAARGGARRRWRRGRGAPRRLGRATEQSRKALARPGRTHPALPARPRARPGHLLRRRPAQPSAARRAAATYARIVAPQEHDHVALLQRKRSAARASGARVRLRRGDVEPGALPPGRDRSRGGDRGRVHRPGREPHTQTLVTDAAGIVAVEARHAAWIRDLAGASCRPRGRPTRGATPTTSCPAFEPRGTCDDARPSSCSTATRRSLESIAVLHGETRAELPAQGRRSAAPPCSRRSRPPRPRRRRYRDVDILNFGLRFERLQATFYTRGRRVRDRSRKMPAAKRRWASVLGAHERAHVRILKRSSARKAGKRPFFDFHGVTETDDRVHADRRRDGGPDGRAARRRDAAPARSPAHRGALRTAHDRGAPRRVGAPHRRHARPRRRSFDQPRVARRRSRRPSREPTSSPPAPRMTRQAQPSAVHRVRRAALVAVCALGALAAGRGDRGAGLARRRSARAVALGAAGRSRRLVRAGLHARAGAPARRPLPPRVAAGRPVRRGRWWRRRGPDRRIAAPVARVEPRTPEGTTNIVLVLGRREDADGRLWVRVAARDAAQRAHRLAAAQRSSAGYGSVRHAPRRRPSRLHRDAAAKARPRRLPRAGRRRPAAAGPRRAGASTCATGSPATRARPTGRSPSAPARAPST